MVSRLGVWREQGEFLFLLSLFGSGRTGLSFRLETSEIFEGPRQCIDRRLRRRMYPPPSPPPRPPTCPPKPPGEGGSFPEYRAYFPGSTVGAHYTRAGVAALRPRRPRTETEHAKSPRRAPARPPLGPNPPKRSLPLKDSAANVIPMHPGALPRPIGALCRWIRGRVRRRVCRSLRAKEECLPPNEVRQSFT